MSERLIYGKNDMKYIVSIEVDGDTASIFREKDGKIKREVVPHKYWILSNEKHDNKYNELLGNQHYKYGKQFSNPWGIGQEKAAHPGKDFFAIGNATEAMQVKDGYSYYKGLSPNDVSILSFDIETNGVLLNDDSRVLLIANTFRVNGKTYKKLFSYENYDNDGEMIEDWCNWVRKVNPSIVCGHNIYYFDFPFLSHVAKLHDKELILGRNDSAIKYNNFESKFRIDGTRDLSYRKARIYGREIVDTMFLAYKYDIGRKYESYGLKWIINYEGLEKEDRVFYDAGKIKDNYMIPEEWEKIKAYAEDDGDDSLALFDLMVPPFFYMTQMVPKPMQLMIESASGSQLNSLMVRSYLQERHSIPKADDTQDFEGAISFGEAGIYPNSVSIDIASLYPSVMLQYEVYSAKKDPKKNMLTLLDYLRTERLKNKKLAKETGESKYKHLDGSFKILINSLYGFMGASGLNYNYIEGAALVTEKGREILNTSMDWAKSKGFTVPKGDTDSITIYKNGEKFEKEEIDSLINEINGILPEHINFELDGVYDVLVVFKAKNYAYREGDKISTKGSAIKASAKSQKLKDLIKEMLEGLLYNKDHQYFQEVYVRYCKEAKDVKDMAPWSARRTISAKTLESTRSNETKIKDAIAGTNYVEGDRIRVFYKPDDSLCLVENFNGEYNKTRLLENIYDTICVFQTVLPVKELFVKYALKKNQKLLEEL